LLSELVDGKLIFPKTQKDKESVVKSNKFSNFNKEALLKENWEEIVRLLNLKK